MSDVRQGTDVASLARLHEAIERAITDTGVSWFDLHLHWRIQDGASWSAIVGGEDPEEWDSGDTYGSDPAELLDRARTTEQTEAPVT